MNTGRLLISFGELLKRHRITAGLSQEELADRARISVKTVSALEQSARQRPYRETITALAEALGLSAATREEFERAALRRTQPVEHKNDLLLNMPRVATPLVDRHEDVQAVLDLLSHYPLVTITGSGGVGKTRVAVAVAERFAQVKMGEAAFVNLSPLSQGSQIPGTVAAALGAPNVNDSTTATALVSYLRNRTLLLILDNCEHLVDEVARFVNSILQGCRDVGILTTSRQPLELPGEALFRLPSLSFPPEAAATVQGADAYGAIKLFVERAKAADPSFGATDENITLVANICCRLEGIPLAIELAAARLPSLGLRMLRSRLDEGFTLLGPARGVPSRQATMHATIAWSYALLTETERTLLNRLSIFVDGFTLEAAERVCAGEVLQTQEIALLVASLVDKSLVNVSRDVEHQRYRLLESVRAYAAAQLALADNPNTIARRHASWLLELTRSVQQTRPGLSYDVVQTIRELCNLRSALRWAIDTESEEDLVTAGRIAGGLRALWNGTGRRKEYRFWSESLIERIDETRYPEVVARLLVGLGQAIVHTPDAPAVIRRALRLSEKVGDYAEVMNLRNQQATRYRLQGEHAQVESVAADALRIGAEQHLEGSPEHMRCLGTIALAVSAQGRPEEGRAYILQALGLLPAGERTWHRYLETLLAEVEFNAQNTAKALEIAQDANERFQNIGGASGYLHLSISSYHLILNNLDAAASFATDALTYWRGDDENTYWAIQNAATLDVLRDDGIIAARLLGFVDEWCNQQNIRRFSFRLATYEILIQALRSRLSEATLERLMTSGRTMTEDEAIDAALQVLQTLRCKHP